MTSQDFYSDLSPLEQTYWHKLAELFQLVDPQKPEKGCKALILKARAYPVSLSRRILAHAR
jgi:hypothetical protein